MILGLDDGMTDLIQPIQHSVFKITMGLLTDQEKTVIQELHLCSYNGYLFVFKCCQ